MKPSPFSDDSETRKGYPVYSGVLMYFPDAIAAVAKLSKAGNDKHNPDEPLHWAREKSSDHADCIARHLIDQDWTELAWRALAQLQLEEEKRKQKEWAELVKEACPPAPAGSSKGRGTSANKPLGLPKRKQVIYKATSGILAKGAVYRVSEERDRHYRIINFAGCDKGWFNSGCFIDYLPSSEDI